MTSIKDVANLAGVAVGTVSRVINNSGAVKPATRRKVKEAIKEQLDAGNVSTLLYYDSNQSMLLVDRTKSGSASMSCTYVSRVFEDAARRLFFGNDRKHGPVAV